MTPQKGDTVRIRHGQWAGHEGPVVDVWKSGNVAVRLDGFTRTFPVEWVEVIR